jgi:Tfp pilus assembly protein PilW
MKLNLHRIARRRGIQGYSLAEIMITSSVFLMLMTAIIYTYIFALNLHETDRIKLSACDGARKALVPLVDQIRSASKVKIGNGNATNFLECASNGTQSGNAIQIFPTNVTTTWMKYYYETNKTSSNFCKLVYVSSTNNTQTMVAIGDSLTNTLPIFAAEDAYGNPLTTNVNNVVIGVNLQFCQLEYPVVKIGPTNYFQYYQLHTRITRRLMY